MAGDESKIQEGTMTLTNYRIIYSKDNLHAEFPLSFLQKVDSGGGWFSTNNIQVTTPYHSKAGNVKKEPPFYAVQWYLMNTEDKEKEMPFKWQYKTESYYFKKFENSSARD